MRADLSIRLQEPEVASSSPRAGRVMMKVVPLPFLLETEILPPWSRIIL